MAVGLVFGAFDLIDSDGAVKVLAEGTSRGNPVPIEVAVKSWLQDGSIVVTQGQDNREFPVRVKFTGTDLLALADIEAALFAEIGKPNTLIWTPPDEFAPASVFVVVTSSLSQDEGPAWDVLEAQPTPSRVYTINFKCEPFVRSVDEVETAALSIGSNTDVVNDGSLATNWSSTVGAVSSSGGKVQVSTTDDYSTVPLTYTAAVSMTGRPYLYVDWEVIGAYAPTSYFKAFADNVELVRMASTPLTGTLVRHYFLCPDTSVAVFRFDGYVAGFNPGVTTATFKIDQVVKTDVPLSLGTTRQLLRSLVVKGSARTQGRLTIEHATDALGDVMAYTFPDDGRGYVPALRNALTSGQVTTADASLVSGARSVLASIANFDVRASTLFPGTHLVIARLRKNGGTADQTLSITATTMIGAGAVDAPTAHPTTHNMSSTWANYTLGRLILPTIDLGDAANALVRITLTDTDATDDIDFDEMWIYNTDVGQLTQAKCGTAAPSAGGTSNRLFILPATTETPRPRVLRGYAADMTDAFHAGASTLYPLESRMPPKFEPPATAVFTVTSNATAAEVDLGHFPRWFTHAAS